MVGAAVTEVAIDVTGVSVVDTNSKMIFKGKVIRFFTCTSEMKSVAYIFQ